MIYLDNAATTRMREEVAEHIIEYLIEDYSNPSSVYKFGFDMEKKINDARFIIASALKVKAEEVYFTPGGTWSNNIAIRGILDKGDSGKIITTETEHSSVLNPIKKFGEGREIKYVKVDEFGFVDLKDLEILLDEDTALVSIMHVNNELGTIQDIERIGKLIKEKSKALFHVDGVQGFCKVPVDIIKSKVDFYTFSSHKIHGPKGIGALYIKNGIKPMPIAYGGEQESGISPGTENTTGILGFAHAVKIAIDNYEEELSYVERLKSRIIDGIGEKIKGFRVNSPGENSSPFIINIGFSGIKSEILLRMLDDEGICISAGSACSKNKKSKTLESVGVPKEFIDGSIRISPSHSNTPEECDIFIEKLNKCLVNIRKVIGKNG